MGACGSKDKPSSTEQLTKTKEQPDTKAHRDALGSSSPQIKIDQKVTVQENKTVLETFNGPTTIKAAGGHAEPKDPLLSAIAEQQVLIALNQKYPWDQMTAAEHDNIVSRVKLSYPVEETFSKLNRHETRISFGYMCADPSGKYQFIYKRSLGTDNRGAIFGIDHDDEEVLLFDDKFPISLDPEDVPRYAFIVGDLFFLEAADFHRDYFVVYRKGELVYDSLQDWPKELVFRTRLISRPHVCGNCFYMLVDEPTPRMVKVRIPHFESETVTGLASGIGAFHVDQEHVITYITNKRELRRQSLVGQGMPSTVLDFQEAVKDLFHVAQDIFVVVDADRKRLLLTDTVQKLDRFAVWMVMRRRSPHKSMHCRSSAYSSKQNDAFTR